MVLEIKKILSLLTQPIPKIPMAMVSLTLLTPMTITMGCPMPEMLSQKIVMNNLIQTVILLVTTKTPMMIMMATAMPMNYYQEQTLKILTANPQTQMVTACLTSYKI